MKISDILSIIESNYPTSLAYEWDNPGLILGDADREIKKILVSLDVTEDVLEEAIANNADMILSHHPFIFSEIKQINTSSKTGRILLKAAENKIALAAAHTNMDSAEDGINARLCRILDITNEKTIEENEKYPGLGIGRIGKIEKQTLKEFLKKVKNALNTPYLRYSGDTEQIIETAAVGSGSCSEIIPEAIKKGADVIITGDLKYHTCLDYASKSFSIIDAGHFPTEKIATDMFCEILDNSGAEVIKSSQKDIFNIF